MGIIAFFKKKKIAPSSAMHRETKEDLYQAMLNSSAHNDNVKDDIFRQILESLANQTPSDQFASGAVFDITRQQHDTYEKIVRSNNALSLHQFFANAYIQFCNNPGIVGFAPTMVNKNKNDTDPRQWNTDVFNLDNGDVVGLCYIPVQNDDYAARIVGIVIGSKGDGYYYCMLDKEETTDSEVKRNKALVGVETIGKVSGRGFELMNSFLECIKKDYYEMKKYQMPIFILRSMSSDYSYRVQKDDFFIGRACEIKEKLPVYSATRQARIRNLNGKLYIQNWGYNPICINNQDIGKTGESGFSELEEGDRLSICGEEFIIECTYE